MADPQRLLTKQPDVKLSEPWKWVLEDDLAEEEPAGRKLKSEIGDTLVAVHDPPPSYMHSEKSNDCGIKCEVCQSWLILKGWEDSGTVQCSECFATTLLIPAKSGFKYVRCPCNSIVSVREDRQTYLCNRPNCHRLLRLGPDNSVEATQRYSICVLKCYRCQRELHYYDPSRLRLIVKCPTCKSLIAAKPTCTKVLSFFLGMIGIVAAVGGCFLVADDFDRNTGWSVCGGVLYFVSMFLLAFGFRVYMAAIRSGVPQNLNWYDLSKDDFKLLYEKIYFPEENAIQKKQIEVASAPERASDIHPREYPSSYTPCANISNAWIKCDVCQSWMSLKGREDHRMIICSVCFEDTPLRPAKSGFKYVRCLCNRIIPIEDSWDSLLCKTPNCNRLLKLGPENSKTSTKDYSCTRYRCGQCQSISFLTNNSRQIYVHCRICRTILSIRPMYTNIRAFLFALIGLACWAGGGAILVYSFYTDMRVYPVGLALYFASVRLLTADSIYRKISRIVNHVSLEEKSNGI